MHKTSLTVLACSVAVLILLAWGGPRTAASGGGPCGTCGQYDPSSRNSGLFKPTGFSSGCTGGQATDKEMSGTQLTAAYEGAQRWSPFIAGGGVYAEISEPEDCDGSGNVSIRQQGENEPAAKDRWNNDAAAWTNGMSNRTFEIVLNRNYLGGWTSAQIADVVTHEMGHVLGFADVYYTVCSGSTYMYYAIDGLPGSFGPPDECSTQYAYHVGNNPWGCDWDDVSTCEGNGGGFMWSTCTCSYCPIVVDLQDTKSDFTTPPLGVRFDLWGDGKLVQVAWTAPLAPTAFLVLDRNGDRRITNGKELFGTATDGARGRGFGFEALAVFDEPEQGGNSDGWITAADAVFPKLQLWSDYNHDGVSDDAELTRLAAAGVVGISLDYKQSPRRDAAGNLFRYRSRIRMAAGPPLVAWDVFLRVGTR